VEVRAALDGTEQRRCAWNEQGVIISNVPQIFDMCAATFVVFINTGLSFDGVDIAGHRCCIYGGGSRAGRQKRKTSWVCTTSRGSRTHIVGLGCEAVVRCLISSVPSRRRGQQSPKASLPRLYAEGPNDDRQRTLSTVRVYSFSGRHSTPLF